MKSIYLIPAIGFSLCYGATANAVTPTIDEVAKLVASEGAASDFLVYSVAVDGDTAVVGAYGDDDLGSEACAVYVFTRDSMGSWDLQQKLLTSHDPTGEYFGGTVDLDGDTAVISAMG